MMVMIVKMEDGHAQRFRTRPPMELWGQFGGVGEAKQASFGHTFLRIPLMTFNDSNENSLLSDCPL
jgi:hypothetical protein